MEGQIDLKHMKKAEKKALRLAVVTSLMGGMSVKVASATYHIAESTVQVWKRMWREAKTNEPEKSNTGGSKRPPHGSMSDADTGSGRKVAG